MSVFTRPGFGERQVQEWLELAESGAIALPSFQRSYVWKNNQTIADYLLALFEGRPTGIFLILKTNGKPQFASRPLKGLQATQKHADELLLDGQQRLTSLWKALNGSAPVTYYVEVKDLTNSDVSVEDVVFWPKSSATGRAMQDPQKAYRKNLVPISILRDKSTAKNDLGEIWNWCREAVGNGDAPRHLEKTIGALREQVLLRRQLHYFELAADTDKNTAIEIFVQSNKSSVKVNDFEIAVAVALNEGDENLRSRISEFNAKSEVTRHYFNTAGDDDEAVIAPLGEWLLFGACLTRKAGPVAPKKRRFEEIVKNLFEPGKHKANKRLDKLLENIEKGLNAVADHGGPTRDTLPALPPLHVVSALQDVLKNVRRPNAAGICNKLISAYLWRSFCTDRYEAKANDRLYEDYEALRACIEQIRTRVTFSLDVAPRIFDEEEYPLPDAEALGMEGAVPWIKGTSRLGRSIVALTLVESPGEWLTSDRLNTRRVRELVSAGKLDRHHVFPRNILVGKFEKAAVNHGLNGVLLSKSGNQALSKKDPAKYMKWILDQQKSLSEEELRRRVESHLVPYDVIVGAGGVKARYEAFIEERARLVSEKFKELAKLPIA